MEPVKTTPQLGFGFRVNRPAPGQTKVEPWVKPPGYGSEWWNQINRFRLDFSERSFPDPRFLRRELDLTHEVFPDVEDPWMFEHPLIYESSEGQSIDSGDRLMGQDLEGLGDEMSPQTVESPMLLGSNADIIRPIIFDPDTLASRVTLGASGMDLCRRFTDPNRWPYGVRVYPSTSYHKIRAIRWGENYDGPGDIPVHVSNIAIWERSDDDVGGIHYHSKTKIHGGRYTGGASLPDPSLGLYEEIFGGDPSEWTWQHSIENFVRAFRDTDRWPVAGIDYEWGDHLDTIRAEMEIRHQRFLVDFNKWGRNLLDSGVDGLNDGGNSGDVWIEPMYWNIPSQRNYQRFLRTIVSCYVVGVCEALPFADDFPGNPPEGGCNPGFRRNTYAEVNGEPYCRYKMRCPARKWKNKVLDSSQDIDWFKYMDVPRRAAEYDGHYRLLLDEILFRFRSGGFKNVIQNAWGGVPGGIEEGTHYSLTDVAGNGYAVTALMDTTNDAYQLGQLLYESSEDHDKIPSGTVMFWFEKPHPDQLGLGPLDDGYEEAYVEHCQGRVWAWIWQINTHQEKEKWVVELKGDYISPQYRIYMAQIGQTIGGYNPCVRDLATKGEYNEGMRDYLEPYHIEEIGITWWKWVNDGYELNPHGFLRTEGGLVWYAGSPKSGPRYMEVPDPRASGVFEYYGLPGEEIPLHKLMVWTPHQLVKWGHIEESYEKLWDPTITWDVPPVSGSYGFICSSTDTISINPFMRDQINELDIVLKSDIQHARNLVLPICAFKLTPQLPLDTSHIEFDWSRQDWSTRGWENLTVSAQRMGYRVPPIHCWMQSTKNGEDTPEYFYYLAKSVISPHRHPRYRKDISPPGEGVKLNERLRHYMPGGQKWWFDNGLLGCGYEEGTATSGGMWPKFGEGFVQKGSAGVSFWRRYIPADKEIVAAYLRLIPSRAPYITPRRVQLLGTKQFRTVPGNFPFVGQDVYDKSRDAMILEFGLMIPPRVIAVEVLGLWGASRNYLDKWDDYVCPKWGYTARNGIEGRFIRAYQATRIVCGDYSFHYHGTFGINTAPSTGVGYDALFFKRYKESETKRGHLLDGIRVTVNGLPAGTSGTTKQRSLYWYTRWVPYFKSGRHTKDNYSGLNTRLDNDEADGHGYGFSCTAGGWAADHRVFDITSAVKRAYTVDRFDARYISETYGTDWTRGNWAHLLEAGDQLVAHGGGAARPALEVNYTGFGGRAITSYCYPNLTHINDILTDTPSGDSWGRDVGDGMAYAVYDLRQYAWTDPQDVDREDRYESGVLADIPNVEQELHIRDYPAICKVTLSWSTLENEKPPQILVFFNPWRDRSQLGSSREWVLLDAVLTDQHPEGTYEIHCTGKEVPLIHDAPPLARSIRVVLPRGGYLTQLYVEGVPMIDHLVGISDPPRSETFDVATALTRTDYSKWTNVFPLQLPPIKVYDVRFDPYIAVTPEIEEAVSDGDLGSFRFQFAGLYEPTNPPSLYFSEAGYPVSGTWCFDPVKQAVVVSSLLRYDPSTSQVFAPGNNPEVPAGVRPTAGPLSGAMVSVSYIEGAGAPCRVLAVAEHTGPAYDVDPDSIIEIVNTTDFPSSGICGPASGITGTWRPWLYHGSEQELIPLQTLNEGDPFNGYRTGNIPGDLKSVSSPRGIYWQGDAPIDDRFTQKANVIQTVYGDACLVLPQRITFQAPGFKIPCDPVTGERLDPGFATGGFSADTWPNGGRIPCSLTIKLEASDPASTPPAPIVIGSDEVKPFKKKQAAFKPEVLVYVRERTKKYLGNTTYGLTFEE